MIFRFPWLKGHVELDGKNKISFHNADPDLKYMKDLAKKAKVWQEVIEEESEQ